MKIQEEEDILEELLNAEKNAAARKRRLLEQKQNFGEFRNGLSSKGLEQIKIFRNYEPMDVDLKAGEGPNEIHSHLHVVDEQIKEHLEYGKETTISDELDITKLQPRKLDWDLKRDEEGIVNKLDRRTQKAIIQLIVQKYADKSESLDEIVNAATSGLD
uniref:Coiled-coil domain-containing protein 12 n=2 Tax=Rhabditophanes sp. KR3021 TaxID=114890 RepID=A0AC35UDG2_9BILA